MNSIKDFSALRPDVGALSSTEADRLWERISPSANAATIPPRPAGDAGEAPIVRLTDIDIDVEPLELDVSTSVPGAQRRRRWALLGAAASLIVGVGAIAIFAGEGPAHDGAAQQAPVEPPSPEPGVLPATTVPRADRVPEPPVLDLRADGWALTGFDDEITAGNGAGAPSSILAPVDSLDRWIRFTEIAGTPPPPTTVPLAERPDPHSAGARSMTAETSQGTSVYADGWGYDAATFESLVDEVLVDGTVPDGQIFLSATDAAQFNRYVHYQFDNDGGDQHLEVVLSPGGGAGLPTADTAPSADFEINADQPEPNVRMAAAVRGFWALNAVAEGFDSDADLQAVLDTLSTVDNPAQRAAAIAAAEKVQEAAAAAARDASDTPASVSPGAVPSDATIPGAAQPPSTTVSTVPKGGESRVDTG